MDDWFTRRLPTSWFAAPVEVTADDEEILVVGRLADPAAEGVAPEEQRLRREDAIRRFREETREERVAVAREAERRFRRRVAWGAVSGDVRRVFTSHSSPVMTRLRMPERRVLDTLVAAGVARTRSDALAWCVRMVGEHEATWLQDLREALVHVRRVRDTGPRSKQATQSDKET